MTPSKSKITAHARARIRLASIGLEWVSARGSLLIGVCFCDAIANSLTQAFPPENGHYGSVSKWSKNCARAGPLARAAKPGPINKIQLRIFHRMLPFGLAFSQFQTSFLPELDVFGPSNRRSLETQCWSSIPRQRELASPGERPTRSGSASWFRFMLRWHLVMPRLEWRLVLEQWDIS